MLFSKNVTIWNALKSKYSLHRVWLVILLYTTEDTSWPVTFEIAIVYVKIKYRRVVNPSKKSYNKESTVAGKNFHSFFSMSLLYKYFQPCTIISKYPVVSVSTANPKQKEIDFIAPSQYKFVSENTFGGWWTYNITNHNWLCGFNKNYGFIDFLVEIKLVWFIVRTIRSMMHAMIVIYA